MERRGVSLRVSSPEVKQKVPVLSLSAGTSRFAPAASHRASLRLKAIDLTVTRD